MRPSGLLYSPPLSLQMFPQSTATSRTQLTMQLAARATAFPLLLANVLASVIQSVPPLNLESSPSNGTTGSALSATRIHCDGDIYRRGLNERSCANAYDGISMDTEFISFGTRGGPVHWQVDLPLRWISGRPPLPLFGQHRFFVKMVTKGYHSHIDDGLCVFDVYTADQTVTDDARMMDFRRAAYDLVHSCILGVEKVGEGGIATRIGNLCSR